MTVGVFVLGVDQSHKRLQSGEGVLDLHGADLADHRLVQVGQSFAVLGPEQVDFRRPDQRQGGISVGGEADQARRDGKVTPCRR